MNVLPYLWFQFVFVGLTAAGWVWGIEPARWMVHAAVWGVLLPAGLFCAISGNLHHSTAARAPFRAAVAIASRLAYLSALLLLLWHGAWITGAAMAVCVACMLWFGWRVACIRSERMARHSRRAAA